MDEPSEVNRRPRFRGVIARLGDSDAITGQLRVGEGDDARDLVADHANGDPGGGII